MRCIKDLILLPLPSSHPASSACILWNFPQTSPLPHLIPPPSLTFPPHARTLPTSIITHLCTNYLYFAAIALDAGVEIAYHLNRWSECRCAFSCPLKLLSHSARPPYWCPSLALGCMDKVISDLHCFRTRCFLWRIKMRRAERPADTYIYNALQDSSVRHIAWERSEDSTSIFRNKINH